MVVFTCQHCNDALKKPVVEKHYNTKCRRNPYLTCVDCLKDFRGDEYISHTSCVSEDQRYGDKNFVPKPVAVKQNNWLDVVHSCIKNNTNPKYFSSFQRLINCSNIPRKKPKFLNFMKNAMNLQNTALCEEMFDLFQKEFENFNSKKNNLQMNNIPKTIHESDESSKNILDYQTKKKRNHLSEAEIKDEDNINSPAEQKKKKPKKQKSDCLSDPNNQTLSKVDSVSNDNVENEDIINDKKIDKKKKENTSQNKENLEESCIVDNEASQVEMDENLVATSVSPDLEAVQRLTKKELKKLKKKQKFEAELKNIEAEKPLESNELQEDTLCEQLPVETKTKKKKRKARLSESEPDQMKKQKTEESIEPETESIWNESRTEDPNRKVKFQWSEVIKQILHNSSDHEISLKRLTKKVFAEYQSVKGDKESYEELMSKFNKKVNKIPGVKIIKDKAKLIV